MSAELTVGRGTSSGLGVIRRISERLSSPLPQRTRFLRELAFDLRELTDRLIDEGIPPAEAHRRATEALVPDAVTLADLDRMHAPWYRRATLHLDPGRLHRIERSVFAVAVIALLAGEAAMLLQVDLIGYAVPYLWVVLCIGSIALTAIAAKAFELWIKRDHSRLRRGLTSILVLSGATIAVGFASVLLDLFFLMATLEGDPSLAGDLLPHSLIQYCAILSIAILFSLAGGIGWLVLKQWITLTEDAHRRTLELDSTLFQEH